MNDDRRDIELGVALEQLPVPDHHPGFFEALAAAMAGEVNHVEADREYPEGVAAMKTLTRQPESPPVRTPRRWVWAIAAAMVVILAIGLAAIILPGGDDFVDEPTTAVTTTTAASTEPASPATTLPVGAVDLSAFTFPVDQVPAFTATVVYDMNPLSVEGSIPPGARLTVQIKFKDSDNYLYEVLYAEPATEGMHVFGAPGLTVLRSSGETWIKEPGDEAPLRGGDFEPVNHLLWNTGYPAWDELCANRFQPAGVETVAGRTAISGRCSDLANDYDLWVDTETGIVMRMRGALGIGDWMPATTRDGGYQIIEFELGEVELPDAPVGGGAADPSALPPFHAIQVEEYVDPPVKMVWEIWYQNETNWKRELLESNNEEYAAGYFDLIADGLLRGCDPLGPYCWEQEDPEPSIPLAPVPTNMLAEHCDLVGEEQVLGRSADHFSCEVWFSELGTGQWTLGGDLDGVSHYWIDQVTSLQLRHEYPNRTESLTTFGVNPLFSAGVFDYEPLQGTGSDGETCDLSDPVCEFWSRVNLVKGEPPPNLSGPLLDGSVVSIEGLRGRPAVLYRWADVSTPGILEEQLDTVQALYEKWGDQVAFLGLSEESPDATQRIIERGAYTFDNLACYGPGGPYCDPQDGQNVLEIWWGDWLILDAAGNVYDGFYRTVGTLEHVDSVIEAVLSE